MSRHANAPYGGWERRKDRWKTAPQMEAPWLLYLIYLRIYLSGDSRGFSSPALNVIQRLTLNRKAINETIQERLLAVDEIHHLSRDARIKLKAG